jgi:uncharacterized protein YggE
MRALVLAFAISAVTASAAAQPASNVSLDPGATLLNISAEGQSRRTPDVALFSSGVVTQGKTAGEAFSANAARMDAVIAALGRAGIAKRDLQTSAISLQPRYSDPQREAEVQARMERRPFVPPAEPAAPRIIGYEARNAEARTAAMRRARERAELYARAAGLRVSRIVSISEGGGYYPVQDVIVTGRTAGFAPPPPPPPTPVAPGELALGISLSVQFALER